MADIETTHHRYKLRQKRVRAGLRAVIAQQHADLLDCFNAIQTQFERCGCGRIKEKGIICPTNAEEMGTCKDGL